MVYQLRGGRVLVTVDGEPASKANKRQLVFLPSHQGNLLREDPKGEQKLFEYVEHADEYRPVRVKRVSPRFVLSPKAKAYVKAVESQVPVQRALLEGELRAFIWVWYETRRPDLDESLLLDALQERVYRNDRQIRERHVQHLLDRVQPRAAVLLESRT